MVNKRFRLYLLLCLFGGLIASLGVGQEAKTKKKSSGNPILRQSMKQTISLAENPSGIEVQEVIFSASSALFGVVQLSENKGTAVQITKLNPGLWDTGYLEVGDIITNIDMKPASDKKEFERLLLKQLKDNPDETMLFQVYRGSRKYNFYVEKKKEKKESKKSGFSFTKFIKDILKD